MHRDDLAQRKAAMAFLRRFRSLLARSPRPTPGQGTRGEPEAKRGRAPTRLREPPNPGRRQRCIVNLRCPPPTFAGLLVIRTRFAPRFQLDFLPAPLTGKRRGNVASNVALSAMSPAVVAEILHLAVWFAVHGVLRVCLPIGTLFSFAAGCARSRQSRPTSARWCTTLFVAP